MEWTEFILFPAGASREPIGRIVSSAGEVLGYRCQVERSALIHELDETDHLTLTE